MDPKLLERRLTLMSIVTVLIFALLTGRLAHLQITEGEKYEKWLRKTVFVYCHWQRHGGYCRSKR